jgi:hypothetical protein
VESRYCSNCRAELPPKTDSCPACGVFAGELYDERMHRPKPRLALFGTLFVIALLAGGAAVWWNAQRALPDRAAKPQEAPRTRVVADRPGGAKRAKGAVVNQAEAIRILRRHLVTTRGLKNECIVALGEGSAAGAYVFSVRDHCSGTRMGKFRVDAKTGDVR